MFTNVNLAAPLVPSPSWNWLPVNAVGPGLCLHAGQAKVSCEQTSASRCCVVVAIYVAVLFLFSFTSNEQALARGQEKHFCELDCHLAYSIIAVTDSKTIGSATANGTFRSVTIKTRFDEHTISPRRGNGLLYPNSRVVMLVDDQE